MTIKRLFWVIVPLALVGTLFFWKYLVPKQVFLVSEIIDGDTIRLANGTRVRYIGIDAPETGECYAQEAKQFNQKLVTSKRVRIETDLNEMDHFGRRLAYVFVKDTDGEEIFVNEYLLSQGAAEFFLDTVNQRYQSALVAAARKSHAEKKGLWSYCAPYPEVGCLIKGNVDRLDQRWYHLPSFRHYAQTVVNLEHGDRWFCTEDQAQKAGFQRARE